MTFIHALVLLSLVAHGQHFALPDDGNELCWARGESTESCCRGDGKMTIGCWDDTPIGYSECCPNADCWDNLHYSYEQCCVSALQSGPNAGTCWSGLLSWELCCAGNETGLNWLVALLSGSSPEGLYNIEEFYNDAQYGNVFGYYSTGRVLKDRKADPVDAHSSDKQHFAHFTTYPMALSPHFGRVICRLLFLMWVRLEERSPFRVVEMGAGSGQLALDVRKCVQSNELGVAPQVWRRFRAAFEYLIVERSPALAKRQRQRGLRVLVGDAQTSHALCQPVLEALAAFEGSGLVGPPSSRDEKHPLECEVGVNRFTGAAVVLSNELLDAFAPLKLRITGLARQPDVRDCSVWQEFYIVHTLSLADFHAIVSLLSISADDAEVMLENMRSFTHEFFCGMLLETAMGRSVRQVARGVSCLALVLALAQVMTHQDLHLPWEAQHMRFRLSTDTDLQSRLQGAALDFERSLGSDALAITREVYRVLRKILRVDTYAELIFLDTIRTHQLPLPLSSKRCTELSWWMETHESRLRRLVGLYADLGYSTLQLIMRLGEGYFAELADCLVGDNGGFTLTVDYGASFEALGNSYSVDAHVDGIFIPPSPQELFEGLPDCFGAWTKCAGLVDWTSFVDFTNLAAAGERFGWSTRFYGPQGLLEHMGRLNVTCQKSGVTYDVPGYSVLEQSWVDDPHVRQWYGRESRPSDMSSSSSWTQRWSSFKALLMEKRLVACTSATVDAPLHDRRSEVDASTSQDDSGFIVALPSWHLDGEQLDDCWNLDPSAIPSVDFVRRQLKKPENAHDLHGSKNTEEVQSAIGMARWQRVHRAVQALAETVHEQMDQDYAVAYEEAQLAVRLVDWLVATEGCNNFRPDLAGRRLESNSLRESLRGRLVRAWGTIWGGEALERVAVAILLRLAARPDLVGSNASPAECVGQRTFIALCERPGGAERARVSPYPPPRV